MAEADPAEDGLAILADDHVRQRDVLVLLRRLADERTVGVPEARAVAGFLEGDWRRHQNDEDETLFPLLRRRAHPEDRLDPILDQLHEDHQSALSLASRLVRALSWPVDSRGMIALSRRTAMTIRRFVALQTRHLAIENAVVLTLARVRLTRVDLRRLAERIRRSRKEMP